LVAASGATLGLVQQVMPTVAPRVETGFKSIFDGKTLTGWAGDPKYRRVENDCLVGEVTPATILKKNSLTICRGGTARDFEFKVEFRASAKGNSVNYRGEEIAGQPHAMRGYQTDIDGAQRHTGQNYEEKSRMFLALRGDISRVDADGEARIIGSLGDKTAHAAAAKNEDLNEYHLIAGGNVLTHVLDGRVTEIVPPKSWRPFCRAPKRAANVAARAVSKMRDCGHLVGEALAACGGGEYTERGKPVSVNAGNAAHVQECRARIRKRTPGRTLTGPTLLEFFGPGAQRPRRATLWSAQCLHLSGKAPPISRAGPPLARRFH